jgi:integrase
MHLPTHISDTRLERSPKTGYWEIRWTEPGPPPRTRTHSCRTKDRALAEQVRENWVKTCVGVVATTRDVTVGWLIREYRVHHIAAMHKGATQEWSLRPVERALNLLTLGSLNASVIQTYTSTRVRIDGVSNSTVRRELGALRAVLSWADKNNLLPAGSRVPHIPLPPEGAPRTVVLSLFDRDKVWVAAIRRWRDLWRFRFQSDRTALFVLIALATGSRARAIETLTWDRVDFANKTIDFRDPSVRVTKKRRVAIPMSNDLFDILKEEWVYQRQPVSGPVLGHTGSTRKGFETFMAGLGFSHVTRHDLRRTWATLAAQAGVPMWEIAGVLGDTVETVTKHYAHHSPGHLRAAVNARP